MESSPACGWDAQLLFMKGKGKCGLQVRRSQLGQRLCLLGTPPQSPCRYRSARVERSICFRLARSYSFYEATPEGGPVTALLI